MAETAGEYTQRMLSYAEGKDPLTMQKAAPGKLARLLRGKSGRQLTRPPAPGKWSIAQILAHLADAEVVVSWRMRHILGTNGAAIQAFDQNVWADTFDYAHHDARQSLASYTALRAANIALLKKLPRPLWDNYGIHSERGNESISHMVRMTAGHDVNHYLQAERILKAKR
jgi:uncharacterized damage-inducible protein DinB